nr:hypothetical protein Iba_chr14cCG11240 [Ipomoea batatas]GMD93956.1 hypothetical protein Iba_chr14fCG12490 [Ipomoea batatas]
MNVTSTVCIFQSIQSFLRICVSSTQHTDHNSFTVPTKRILKQTRQLAISVWNMSAFFSLLLITKSTNYISQSK